MIGKAECSVDDKRRFSLPPKYRKPFGVKESDTAGHYYPTVVLPWFKGALAVIPDRMWSEISQGLDRLDYTNEDFETAKLICLSRAENLNTDPEGRLTLTPDHMSWLRIPPGNKGRLVLVGLGRYLQIFNATEWPEVQQSGINRAARPGEDLVYDKALRELLDLGRKALEEFREAERAAALAARGEP